MSATKIEWAEQTWNPIIGCTRVSPGCDGCYAVGQVRRGEAFGTAQHVGLTVKPEGGRADWTGEVRLWEPKLDEPLRRKVPTRYFVNSLSDLFHPDLPDEAIARVFAVMALAPQHTFMVLTKRPQRMAGLLDDGNFWGEYDSGVYGEMNEREPERDEAHSLARFQLLERAWASGLPNVWLGTSIESDRYAFRADHLRRTPAAIRFVSAEPLLGPLPSLDLAGIDWLIVGGESGPGARPMHPDWVRDLRDRCGWGFHPRFAEGEHPHCTEGCAAECHPANRLPGPAFFFKQWGEWWPFLSEKHHEDLGGQTFVKPDGTTSWAAFSEPGEGCSNWSTNCDHETDAAVTRVGKKAAGRELDGRTWDEFPEARP